MVHMIDAEPDFHEKVHVIDDPARGARGVIVIHSRRLGPAAGGCRLWHYADDDALFTDAVRLARGMTYKNALAGLPFGGGKAVLQRPDRSFDRAALFHALGDAVEELGGAYVTAEDVGTGVDDMHQVAERTRHVAGLKPRDGRAGGDPSPWTARGVYLSMAAAVRETLGTDMRGLRIAVQGAGHVGLPLIERLAADGAKLIVADADPRRAAAAERLGANIVDPESVLAAEADVLAPCALGGVLNEAAVAHMSPAVRVICGAANNQLADAVCGEALAGRGVVYVPDFVANAGGIISVSAEYLGESEADVRQRVDGIPDRVLAILRTARTERRDTQGVAEDIGRTLLSQAA